MTDRPRPRGAEDIAYGPVLRPILVANPAAGQPIIVPVPGRTDWFIKGFNWTLTTSATVLNREVVLGIDDQTNILAFFPALAVQVMSTAVKYSATPRQSSTAATGSLRQSIGLPNDYRIPAGHRLRVDVDSIDAADAFSAITLWVLEVPTLSEYGWEKATLEHRASEKVTADFVLSDLERRN